jgi:poly(hydroxyalkanoate) granule-associated protein
MAKAKLKSKPAAKPAETGKAAGKSIMESAQQIWLAGLGAFAKAQGEGGRLFETLIREGSSLEEKTRKIATSKADEVRGAVESGVSQVRERTQETWDKLEQVFESRVARALAKLGVPARKDLDDLIRRVDDLNRQVRRLDFGKPAATMTQAFTTGVRRSRDELGDLVKDIEEVQLAARQNAKSAVVRPAPVKPPPARPAVVKTSAAKRAAAGPSAAKPAAAKPAARAAHPQARPAQPARRKR